MALDDERWVEISASQFEHETEGLDIVRNLLPNQAPYHAWSNFEFRDDRGRWHEVDLLVLARDQLHLVELKYYSGILRGDDHRWVRAGRRAEVSPLKLARRKAQYLASRLKAGLDDWAREANVTIPDQRDAVPFVQESVFLHHPRFQSKLSEHSAQGLYGLDGNEDSTGLPGISELLLAGPQHHRTTTATQARLVPVIMKRLGLQPQSAERTAGSWVIEQSQPNQGEGWQDWSAHHQVTPSERARIRIRVAPPGADQASSEDLRELATHEYRTMSRLVHDGLLRPLDVVESELGTGVVYPETDSLQRLDLWLADQGQGTSLDTQLSIVRQVAEAVHYAHGNAVAHRDLGPESVWIKETNDGPKALVGNWHVSGHASDASTQSSGGVTSLLQVGSTDSEAVFRAPEGTWVASATDRFRLDVFGIGALTYYLLTGEPPATSTATLRERLRTQNGLDITPVLPEAAEPLRTLVQGATHPAPSKRIGDLAAFLTELASAERLLSEPDQEALDPLEAHPGSVLADRFQLLRRLGRGSTAVGLLVRDVQAPREPERVLKVALDDAAAGRLDDEARVLAGLDSPRIVRLVEGPIEIAGRRALLLETAGTQTLAEVMRERARLSLDLLQRYGTDLLKVLVDLDRAGVDHRDIKPANLGVRESRGKKHLVLFDFSLARAAAAATDAGTPPYLDPFLGAEGRENYDSAAERYAAAVVLFEMATGEVPVFGDGLAHPATIKDDARLNRGAFDDAIADVLHRFFQTALARDASARHHTAADMLREWEAAFPDSLTTVPDDAVAAAVTLSTPLGKSGLTPRALSALEPLAIETVGELLMVDTLSLSLKGAADRTRTEVRQRAKQWRTALKDDLRGLKPVRESGSLPSPLDAADLLLTHSGRRASENRSATVRLLLGVPSGEVGAFATHAELAAHLPKPVTPARATQILTELQGAWATASEARELLTALDEMISRRLADLGGVATSDELARTVLQQMTPTGQTERDEGRIAHGLVRIVLDRQRALARADDEEQPLVLRRHSDQSILVATQSDLLDVADALGREADRLVTEHTGENHDRLVAADLATERLHPFLDSLAEKPASLLHPGRLIRLAAAASTNAAASGAAELHHRDLPAPAAVARALRSVSQPRLSPATIQQRVRARFPALPPLPGRPALDDVIARSGIDRTYDEDAKAYRSITPSGGTTGLETRQVTSVAVEAAPVSVAGVTGQRLRDSRARRSFLALGVPGHRMNRVTRVLGGEYDAHPIDVTEVLLGALREQAETAGMSWHTIEAADAAAEGSRPARGLAALVARAVPAVATAVEEAMGGAPEGERPVLLTNTAPLARYGHLAALTQWTDLTRPRRQAVWLMVPQLRGSHGPLLDGHPVTLNSPGQYLPLEVEWIDTRDRALETTGAST